MIANYTQYQLQGFPEQPQFNMVVHLPPTPGMALQTYGGDLHYTLL